MKMENFIELEQNWSFKINLLYDMFAVRRQLNIEYVH